MGINVRHFLVCMNYENTSLVRNICCEFRFKYKRSRDIIKQVKNKIIHINAKF